MGELAQIGTKHITDRLVTVVQTFVSDSFNALDVTVVKDGKQNRLT